jgi:putative phosphoribosyl transferase
MTPMIECDATRVGPRGLRGEWARPARVDGLVVFVHGSGSGRASPRNRFVTTVLHEHGMATLLFDLLTEDEALDRRKVFDIDLLTQRVVEVLDWLLDDGALSSADGAGGRRTSLFGASTGAAAALRAAAERPGRVRSVVSRGGRVDLAAPWLAQVRAPTLLIVGGDDREVLQFNREALRALRCEKRLEVVPGAGHLFEEPGALDAVAHLAADWFALRSGRPDATA